jgi:hypothetical protein
VSLCKPPKDEGNGWPARVMVGKCSFEVIKTRAKCQHHFDLCIYRNSPAVSLSSSTYVTGHFPLNRWGSDRDLGIVLIDGYIAKIGKYFYILKFI